MLKKGDMVTWEAAVHFGIRQRFNGTVMIETFSYQSPLGIIGRMVDFLFLERYIKNFVASRAEELKKIAEKNDNVFSGK